MITKRYDYSEMTRENINGSRHYVTPDGRKLPSVTTILDRTKPHEEKQLLLDWKKRVGEVEASKITLEAAGRGTKMHGFLEVLVETGEWIDPGNNQFSIQSHKMAKKIVTSSFHNINEFWGSEVALHFPEIYAGTTDLVGVWKGKSAILDFKQSNKPKKKEWISNYFMQLCSYALAHNEIYDTKIETGVILMCTADYEYQEFVIEGDEFHMWADKWWDRVAQFYGVNA